MTGHEILEEQLSKLTHDKRDQLRMEAVFTLASLSTRTVLEAAEAGNVRCREALKDIAPLIATISKKK